jgi:PhzF family phenazine biosynthesis protein
MKSFRFKKLDAFATADSDGNPAGMIGVDSLAEITAAEMQRIARELRGFVNEVGFVCRTGPDRLALRYYSAEREVLFCGHATIAILYDLLTTDPDLATLSRVNFATATGSLVAENRIAREQAVFISAPPPTFSAQEIAVTEIARALRIDASAIASQLPTARINAGLETLLVPIGSLETTLATRPDERQLKMFCEEHGIDIVTIFTDETARPDTRWRSRVFAPRFGYLEDPATGSGNAALGQYLLRHGLWRGEILTIEQNKERARPNIIKLMGRQETGASPQVLFGGGAVTRIEGRYFLQ